jgi:alginate production protein
VKLRIHRLCLATLSAILLLGVLSESGYAAKAAGAEATPIAKRGPAFDFDAPPETTKPLLPHLTFGAELEIESAFSQNLDLDRNVDDQSTVIEPKIELALSYDPTDFFRAYLELELSSEILFTPQESGTTETGLEVDQLYVTFSEVLKGITLQAGRQEFKDKREWLFDENFDAVRVFYRISAYAFEISASRPQLTDNDLLLSREIEAINHYYFRARYQVTEATEAAFYVLLREDRTPARERPLFLGFHTHGEIANNLDFWSELLFVGGNEQENRIRAYGLDVGLIREFDLPLEPSVTLAYAFGSGDDDPEDDVNTRFRQTGFQDNSGKFGGGAKIQYYGEVFDPELSNLAILTAGLGAKPVKNVVADLVYHHVRQHKKSAEIRDSRLERDPTGDGFVIGDEINLVLGYEIKRPEIEIELKAGYFIPGDAFPSDAVPATRFEFNIEYTF